MMSVPCVVSGTMMSERGALEPAYVLHARDYRDTSLIVDVLTRNTGRYAMVVKGARSVKSRVRGRLQPFAPLLVASVGRGDLKTSTQVDASGPAFRFGGDALMLGLYVNELLYRLVGRFIPLEALFEEYEILLASLEQGLGVLAVRRFELMLLQELGYGISFEFDARNGEAIEATSQYEFAVNEGFFRASETTARSFSGAELLQIASGELQRVADQKLKWVTRPSLGVLLGDRPLKSRALFRSAAR